MAQLLIRDLDVETIERLKARAKLHRRVARWGGDLCGVAEAGPLREIATIPPNLLDAFTRAARRPSSSSAAATG